MLFGPKEKILFIGDSITDCDRQGSAAPYGDGYVSMTRNFLLARYPELHLRFVNKGIGGNTVRDLADRWERDVIAERPDWLSVKIGINDVWRGFRGNAHEAVPLEEYTTTLRELLVRTATETGARLIVMEPYMIERDRTNPMRNRMDEFGAAARRLAAENNAVIVRTQAAFDTVLEHTNPGDWASDQIHPGAPGHAVIALAFLRAIGFEI